MGVFVLLLHILAVACKFGSWLCVERVFDLHGTSEDEDADVRSVGSCTKE